MCLMLYLASPRPLVGAPPSPLQISLAAPKVVHDLRRTLSQPHVALVAVDGCSCAFPSCSGEPGEHCAGLLGDEAQRALDAAHVRALLELVARVQLPGDIVELFPVWCGEEHAGARGHVETSTSAIDAERFGFAESHLYVLRS